MREINYGRHTIIDEDIAAVNKVLHSKFLTQGPTVPEFETCVAEYHKAKYAVAFSNGTAALHGAYYAFGVGRDDEVITSPLTFAATANAAVYLGGRPVFADIDPLTACIDIKDIEHRISKKSKVITPVSLSGYPVDLKAIKAIADVYGIKVLHDAAHAIASKREDTFGMEYVDAAILSFHPVKHVATGEGGMVLTNDKDIYDRLLLFRNHGITKTADLLSAYDGPWYYEMLDLGFNYRLSDIHAALGVSQFTRIDANIRSRNEIARFYDKSLSNDSRFILPPNVGYEIINDISASMVHSWHLYSLRLKDTARRHEFYDYLHEHGIYSQVHYIPVHLMPYYQKTFGYSKGDYPIAEQYYAGEMSIPMFHNMSKEDMSFVTETVCSFP